jgi:hypothetical protein
MIEIVVELATDGKKLSLTKKVLLVTALYAQVAHSPETRHLVGEIALIDLAKAIGVPDYDQIRRAAQLFDDMLAERDWTFMVEKTEGKLSWRFCNCGKEDCEGHDL